MRQDVRLVLLMMMPIFVGCHTKKEPSGQQSPDNWKPMQFDDYSKYSIDDEELESIRIALLFCDTVDSDLNPIGVFDRKLIDSKKRVHAYLSLYNLRPKKYFIIVEVLNDSDQIKYQLGNAFEPHQMSWCLYYPFLLTSTYLTNGDYKVRVKINNKVKVERVMGITFKEKVNQKDILIQSDNKKE